MLEQACKQWEFKDKAFDETGAWIGRYSGRVRSEIKKGRRA